MDTTLNNNIVWLSVDPVHKKVDLYPKPIAERIEKSFNEQSDNIVRGVTMSCTLGTDFYNATVQR